MVAAVIALGACLALAQAPLRTFELHIAERRVPPAQRVLRATEGERVELRWGAGSTHQHRALLYAEIYPR